MLTLQQIQSLARSGSSEERELAIELLRLRSAIEKHRDASVGHGTCWINDQELWKQLDASTEYPHDSLPVREEFLKMCSRYYESRLTGTPYEEPKVQCKLAARRESSEK